MINFPEVMKENKWCIFLFFLNNLRLKFTKNLCIALIKKTWNFFITVIDYKTKIILKIIRESLLNWIEKIYSPDSVSITNFKILEYQLFSI